MHNISKHTPLKIPILIVLLGLALSACAGATTPSPQVEATAEVMETQAPTSEVQPTEPVSEQPATESPPASSGETVYHIVPGESTLTYEVGEVFLNQGNRFNLAIGQTGQVDGEIIVDNENPSRSSLGAITADISQFTSDSSRRDNALRDRFLLSSQFPMVTLENAQIEGLPQSYQEGDEVPITITGDLTIREVTRPVSFDAAIKLENETLSGSATTTILMSDFGFGPIDVAGILKTEDEAKVTLNFIARP